MSKTFLTGGSSLIGLEIIKQAPCQIYSPSSKDFDLMDTKKIEAMDFKDYDTLILNAGTGMCDHQSIEHNSADKILKIFQINSIANYILVKRFLATRSNGTILYVGGRTTKLCKPTNIAYATSKLAVNKMFASLREVYVDFDFLVINPGKVKSRLNINEPNYDQYIEPADLAQKIWYMIENKILEMDYYEQKK